MSEIVATIRVSAVIVDDPQQWGIATGIQFNVPSDMDREEIRKHFVAHVTAEVERYFSHECIAAAFNWPPKPIEGHPPVEEPK